MENTNSNTWFNRLINGNERLWKVFWIYFILFGIFVNVCLKILVPLLSIDSDISNYGVIIVRVILYIFLMPFLIWKNSKNTNSRVWEIIAKILSILIVILEIIRSSLTLLTYMFI
ncbi:hypothetical protein BVY03_04010 [bacterium K02(2017)]|nr:hypothetical protein BVY03_04010 [bacterium K02(2017)]